MHCPLRILSFGVAVAATSLLLIAANWLTVLVLISTASFAWGVWSFFDSGCAGDSGRLVAGRFGRALLETGSESDPQTDSMSKPGSENSPVNLYRFPAARLAFSTLTELAD